MSKIFTCFGGGSAGISSLSQHLFLPLKKLKESLLMKMGEHGVMGLNIELFFWIFSYQNLDYVAKMERNDKCNFESR